VHDPERARREDQPEAVEKERAERGRRLTGAVRAEEADDLARLDVERDVVDGLPHATDA
jgi:hypothetical protein